MASTNLPGEMLACQVVEFNEPYKTHKVPVPRIDDLGPFDVLVKVAVASFCHTDIQASSGYLPFPVPFTASHEGAGTVIAVGTSVEHLGPGDRVQCGLTRGPCGACDECTGPEIYRQYCQSTAGAIGLGLDGAFAEYVVCDARTSVRIPTGIGFETAAPLACAGITIFRAILLSGVEEGGWLALVGSGGGLGHIGVQFAKAMKMKVIGIDARDEGLALSKECGADVVVDARGGLDHVVKQVQNVTEGRGAAATLNLSDASVAVATACAVTKMHGTMVQIAQPQTINIPFAELIIRDIRVRGSLISSPDEAKRMLQLVADHKINVRTHAFYGLESIPELLDLTRKGAVRGKAIVVVDASQV